MNINKKHLLVLTVIAISITSGISAFLDDFFEEHIKFMQKMHQEMKETRNTFMNSFGVDSKVSIDIKEEDNTVTVSIHGVTTEEFDAFIDDVNKILTVKTPTDHIRIKNKDHILSVEIRQEKKEEKIIEDNKEKQIFYEAASIKSKQRLSSEIDFEQPQITYNEKNKMLTIQIAKKTKKSDKQVTVNIIKDKDQSNKEK